MQRLLRLLCLACVVEVGLAYCSSSATAQVEAVGSQTPWRAFLLKGGNLVREYGVSVARYVWPTLLCLRTCFGVADPARAKDLKVTVTCLGGGVVYVNGQEVGRGLLPAGELHPLTLADDYPAETYTTEDGRTPLPVLRPIAKGSPDPQPHLHSEDAADGPVMGPEERRRIGARSAANRRPRCRAVLQTIDRRCAGYRPRPGLVGTQHHDWAWR